MAMTRIEDKKLIEELVQEMRDEQILLDRGITPEKLKNAKAKALEKLMMSNGNAFDQFKKVFSSIIWEKQQRALTKRRLHQNRTSKKLNKRKKKRIKNNIE